MRRDPEIRAAIEAAQAAAQDYEADLCIEIADAAKTPDEAQVAKLRIWARQWRASKMAPKKYGDRTRTEITGADGGALTVQVLRLCDSAPPINDGKGVSCDDDPAAK